MVGVKNWKEKTLLLGEKMLGFYIQVENYQGKLTTKEKSGREQYSGQISVGENIQKEQGKITR